MSLIPAGEFSSGRARILLDGRSIGHMNTMQDKAYLFEVEAGKGRFMACAMRLTAKGTPAGRYLLQSVLRYLGDATPKPAKRIPAKRLLHARCQTRGTATPAKEQCRGA